MNYEIQRFINRISFGLTETGSGFTIKDIWYNFKYGIKNLYRFFWVVWRWRGWDFSYNLNLFARGLEEYLKMPNYEIDEHRIPKEQDIKKVIEYIKNYNDTNYIELAEEQLKKETTKGKIMEFKEIEGTEYFEMIDKRTSEQIENDTEIYNLADKIEQDQWEEMCEIIKKNGKSWWN